MSLRQFHEAADAFTESYHRPEPVAFFVGAAPDSVPAPPKLTKAQAETLETVSAPWGGPNKNYFDGSKVTAKKLLQWGLIKITLPEKTKAMSRGGAVMTAKGSALLSAFKSNVITWEYFAPESTVELGDWGVVYHIDEFGPSKEADIKRAWNNRYGDFARMLKLSSDFKLIKKKGQEWALTRKAVNVLKNETTNRELKRKVKV